jgi:hypothetical protein
MRLTLLLLTSLVSNVIAAEPPPYDYKIFQTKFNSVYVLPPECVPEHMTWSQADCSNDKVSAARRFSTEWGAGSYWDGHDVVDNPNADKRVNQR